MQGGDKNISFMHLLTTGLFDILFPKYCVSCGLEGSYCCVSCQLQLESLYPVVCFGCRQSVMFGELCADCQPRFSFDGVIIAADYEDEIVGTIIKQCKYRFIKELGDVMGWFLAQKIKKLLEKCNGNSAFEKDFFQSLVIAMPLSRRRQRQREFNQAELVVDFFAHYFSLISLNTILARNHRRPQASLSESARQENLTGSFFIKTNSVVISKMVLVVDDVITTGATLEEAARVLKAAGVEKVWGLMVAKG